MTHLLNHVSTNHDKPLFEVTRMTDKYLAVYIDISHLENDECIPYFNKIGKQIEKQFNCTTEGGDYAVDIKPNGKVWFVGRNLHFRFNTDTPVKEEGMEKLRAALTYNFTTDADYAGCKTAEETALKVVQEAFKDLCNKHQVKQWMDFDDVHIETHYSSSEREWEVQLVVSTYITGQESVLDKLFEEAEEVGINLEVVEVE